jgi:hypothetical protein
MSDYPVEVYELLKWFLENPGGKWADVPEGLKEIGRDFIKRDNLHDDTGTHHTVPGLSAFGRVVLRDRGKTKPPDADDTEKSSDMTWQETAERLEELRGQGEKFTSQQKLADAIGSTKGKVHNAIHKTPSLYEWAGLGKQSKPKAQSITEVVTDRTAQSREISVEDDVSIREFIENAEPKNKAWFQSLSTENQLKYLKLQLDDHDKYDKILGRKP